MKIEYISNGSAISGLAITDMGDGKYENGDALSFVPTGATSQALTLTFSMRGSQGHTFSYEYRTRNAALGTGASNIHTFTELRVMDLLLLIPLQP